MHLPRIGAIHERCGMDRRTLISAIVVVIVVVLVVALLVAGNPAFHRIFVSLLRGPELVQNGSFECGKDESSDLEKVIGGPNCKILCNASGSLFNWQVSGQGGANDLCINGQPRDVICWIVDAKGSTTKVTADEGNRLVALSGISGKPANRYGSVSQDIPTREGQLYELSFSIGSTAKFIDPSSTTRGVEIRVNVGGIIKVFPAASTDDVSHWEPITMQFPASGQTTTLRFSGESQPRINGSGYLGIDNVSVKRVCSLLTVILSGCS